GSCRASPAQPTMKVTARSVKAIRRLSERTLLARSNEPSSFIAHLPSRCDVLFEVLERRGTGNRQHDGRAFEQKHERCLRHRQPAFARDASELAHRAGALTGMFAGGKRIPRNEGQRMSLAVVDDIVVA